jgi:hypothetical protein
MNNLIQTRLFFYTLYSLYVIIVGWLNYKNKKVYYELTLLLAHLYLLIFKGKDRMEQHKREMSESGTKKVFGVILICVGVCSIIVNFIKIIKYF